MRKIPKIRWLSRSEYDALVEAKAQKVLGISAKEFIDNWKRGKYHSSNLEEEFPGIVELSMLAPLPRRRQRTR